MLNFQRLGEKKGYRDPGFSKETKNPIFKLILIINYRKVDTKQKNEHVKANHTLIVKLMRMQKMLAK